MSFATAASNQFTSSEAVKRSAITRLHSCFHSFISIYTKKKKGISVKLGLQHSYVNLKAMLLFIYFKITLTLETVVF